ncbi:MAG: glycerophosphoryl diester phosphodiesterase membrane domain-containing protein [Cylindrospermopsis raciborskii KL1]|uniref:glycerophosphoryl diester phosphodiesterase membrane domain-containing protein n=1 Tax=Cylindrospermopsis raciborskii TaxID=77022 RepID=UPI001A288AD2|nr:glycerophosphoryl diester phosphodiesterase membrane domain-containing protein [Cylindrospermopsis raciborskii]MBG0743889.1 glycerophosphoryl diester phosphodiesterase membrane domain-containing protein [Cylindrospermopsis raciborskii KL1]
MTENRGFYTPAQVLTVGNAVSASVRLYRSHFKDYFLLSLKAWLWILIPVYGWAKFYALSALISRLGFGDLVNQPESVHSGERFVNSRLWQFLTTLILMFFIYVGIIVSFFILGFLLALIPTAILGGLNIQNPTNNGTWWVLIFLLVFLLAIVGSIWLEIRFSLLTLPLAIEENVDATSTIGRSWELTKGHVWRIFLILFVASLITLPMQILLQQIISFVVQGILEFTPDNNPLLNSLLLLLFFAMFIGGSALVLPFWQSLKAVIYYDLRTRREGLGLKLREREI